MPLERWHQQDNLTLADAIQSAAEWLDGFDLVYGHGTQTSLDEAAWLILEAMSLSPLESPDYQLTLSRSQKEVAINYLKKRALDKLPAAYITGRTWFAGLEFKSDERALVPRSPLAEPVMQGFCDYIDPGEVRQVLDLCTGGGCIAVACAYAFADAKVDAVDISQEALNLAQENIDLHHMNDRVTPLCSDLFSRLPDGKQYDLIVSNPPYVDERDMAALGAEFRHEPKLGLAAGNDGLDIVRTILKEAASYLSPAGILVCEVGNSAPALEAAYPQLPFLWLEFQHGGQGIFLLTREALSLANYPA